MRSVRAAAAGVVSFAGVVAGTRYVVVDHAAGGLRATYGDLAASELAVGDVVAAGAVVGRVGERGLHFGLRRGETYVDPAPLLGRLVERPRLVPTDGTPPRPAPPPAPARAPAPGDPSDRPASTCSAVLSDTGTGTLLDRPAARWVVDHAPATTMRSLRRR